MNATVPTIIGLVVFSLCSWRIHQDAVKRQKQNGGVEIIIYLPDGVVIRPNSHR